MSDLQTYRTEIDSIDTELIKLLATRFACVRWVAEYKKINNLPPLQPGRWQEVLGGAKARGKTLWLDPVFVGVVWNVIHEFALVEEEKIIQNNE